MQITVKAGAVTDVTALQLTDDDRKSVQISNRAAPLLRAEVIKAQSAQVQTIGGATVTSEEYLSFTPGRPSMQRTSKPSPAESPAPAWPVCPQEQDLPVHDRHQPRPSRRSRSTPDGGLVLEGAAAAVEHVFTGLDEMFSLYRPDSEASRSARGEVTLRDASAAFRARFEDATGWRLLTEGFFTPERPDGVLDLSGIIKGYAIDQAASALECAGVEDWCLNAGGDFW